MPPEVLSEQPPRSDTLPQQEDTWRKLRQRIDKKLRRQIRRCGYDPRDVGHNDIADAVSAGVVSVVDYWVREWAGEWGDADLRRFNFAIHHGGQRAWTYFKKERKYRAKQWELPHADVLPTRGTPPRYRPAEHLMLPELLDRLPPRQAKVVYLRCGLRETLAATARKVGAHVSTVRRDEAAALGKLRRWYEDEKEISEK